MKRIHSIDFIRGAVMIIMALDHVRDLVHVNAVTQSPTNLSTTTPILFFTRWITYLCAPVFIFLSGTSAYISLKRKNNMEVSKRFLLKRGLWMLLLEFSVVNFAIFFDIGFHTLFFEVIAAFGFGFIVLSLMLRASVKTIGMIGLAIILLHNLSTIIPFNDGSILKTILTPFFSVSVFPIDTNRTFIVAYPPIPWLGIMLIGFASGKFFELQYDIRKKIFQKIGLGSILAFFIIRFINVYGDAVPWSIQKNQLYTFLSFMNVTKYPPSLLFCLITLGIMFISLALAEKIKGKLYGFVTVYGKVPLFYFIVHFFLIHFIMLAVMFLQGFSWSQLDFASGTFGRPKSVASGLSLWVIYVIWVSVVLILYKPCVWYGKYKATHSQWWLKYI